MNFLESFSHSFFEDPLFFVISFVVLFSAILSVSLDNLVRASLALVISFLGISLFYFKLEVLLLAIAQVMVYTVGISLVIIFSIMLLKQAKELDLPQEFQVIKAQTQMITVSSFTVSLLLVTLIIFLALSRKVDMLSSMENIFFLGISSFILATLVSLFLFFIILNFRENKFGQDNFFSHKLIVNKSFFLKDSLKNFLAVLSACGFYLVMNFHVINLDRGNKLASFSEYIVSQQEKNPDQFAKIGEIFVSEQIVSFEAISVLLLVALLISINISKKQCSN